MLCIIGTSRCWRPGNLRLAKLRSECYASNTSHQMSGLQHSIDNTRLQHPTHNTRLPTPDTKCNTSDTPPHLSALYKTVPSPLYFPSSLHSLASNLPLTTFNSTKSQYIYIYCAHHDLVWPASALQPWLVYFEHGHIAARPITLAAKLPLWTAQTAYLMEENTATPAVQATRTQYRSGWTAVETAFLAEIGPSTRPRPTLAQGGLQSTMTMGDPAGSPAYWHRRPLYMLCTCRRSRSASPLLHQLGMGQTHQRLHG